MLDSRGGQYEQTKVVSPSALDQAEVILWFFSPLARGFGNEPPEFPLDFVIVEMDTLLSRASISHVYLTMYSVV